MARTCIVSALVEAAPTHTTSPAQRSPAEMAAMYADHAALLAESVPYQEPRDRVGTQVAARHLRAKAAYWRTVAAGTQGL